MVLDSASGLKNIRLNDLPMREAEEAFQASGIIFDTFEALEQGVFDVLKPMFQHAYVIGPLQMLLNSTFSCSSDHLKAASFSPYGDELNCLE
ncbi:hypothetical protein Vadar_028635 [Vaccinium darrowii]|uniref:Uncharacterized protein n=1 Tax=Vaccinium darrowii TaxID=229202 RepID=A0ACB7ZFN4_9ERIC|nr:hypothetical protein Vadar_028635 [Vaccinium darrowii]